MLMLLQPENQSDVQALIDNFIQNTGSETPINNQVSDLIVQDIIKNDKLLALSTSKANMFLPFRKKVSAVTNLFLSGSAHWVFNSKNDNKGKGKIFSKSSFENLFGLN